MPIGSVLRLQLLQVIFFHPDMTRRNGTHFCGKIMRKRLIWRIFFDRVILPERNCAEVTFVDPPVANVLMEGGPSLARPFL
jgi:hypothetical protein